MRINVHGSLGDQIMLTGIPELYYKLYNEKVSLAGDIKPELWKYNPYVEDRHGDDFSYAFNATEKDYMIYYPVRIFNDMTHRTVDRKHLQPNFYREYIKKPGTIVVNDQAGWPSRRGYIYFDALCKELINSGFTVIYSRNESSLDCFGKSSEKVIHSFSEQRHNLSLDSMINLVGSAEFYIGYDSGMAQVAGATKTKYVLLSSSVPPINTAHDSCIYYLDNINCRRCVATTCNKQCFEDKNQEIIGTIRSSRDEI